MTDDDLSPQAAAQLVTSLTGQYSSEAIQRILSHALALQSSATYSQKQLQEMAAELNIEPEMLTLAEDRWRSQAIVEKRQAALSAGRQRERRQAWMQYGLGSALMVGINIATAGSITWAIFPVMGWGVSLFFEGNCHSRQSPRQIEAG
ncbi:MAG: 2TM domain-containing protein [Cyanobacteria bacterium P01_H01_bin.58]